MSERDKWQLVAWAVAAAVVALVAVRLLAPAGGGGSGATAPTVRVERGEGSAGRGAAGDRDGLFVHVAGAVRRPGLVRVPRGSRVAVAVERAGGPLRRADLAAVNLAAPLQDGQQVVLPRVGSAPAGLAAGAAPPPVVGAAPGTGDAAATTAGGAALISLTTATVEQLDSLDGIGPTLARRIVEHRMRSGGFRSLDQLREVDGIGEKRFEALKRALRL